MTQENDELEKPDFHELMQIDLDALGKKLDAIRRSITHPGEKGRALEHQVMAMLRPVLPQEYGLSTGFVAYHGADGPELSTQLDVIIYDALRGGPLCSLGAFDVFPIESVYGYIEVKTELTSSSDNAESKSGSSIESCIDKNVILRRMTLRKYNKPDESSRVHLIPVEMQWLAIRSYVFAFSVDGKSAVARSAPDMAERMSDYMRSVGRPAHLHGVLIADRAYYETVPVDEEKVPQDEWWQVKYATGDHLLATFISSVLLALARFKRPKRYWSPAISEYFPKAQNWDYHPERENDEDASPSSVASWDTPEEDVIEMNFDVSIPIGPTGPTGPTGPLDDD